MALKARNLLVTGLLGTLLTASGGAATAMAGSPPDHRAESKMITAAAKKDPTARLWTCSGFKKGPKGRKKIRFRACANKYDKKKRSRVTIENAGGKTSKVAFVVYNKKKGGKWRKCDWAPDHKLASGGRYYSLCPPKKTSKLYVKAVVYGKTFYGGKKKTARISYPR